jgi:hypothetical protein
MLSRFVTLNQKNLGVSRNRQYVGNSEGTHRCHLRYPTSPMLSNAWTSVQVLDTHRAGRKLFA